MRAAQPISTANQPPPLAGYNLYEQGAALVEGVRREGGGPWKAEIAVFGEVFGGEPLECGRLANEHARVPASPPASSAASPRCRGRCTG